MTLGDLRYRHTEEFIEDKFPVDIRYKLRIECKVTRNGSYVDVLRHFKNARKKLNHGKKLEFFIEKNTTPVNDASQGYKVFWKVLNRGEEAQRRDVIRGQIESDLGKQRKNESADFNGEHIVECYIVQNGVVVARDRIYVPIEE